MGALRWLWQRFLTNPENMGGLGLVLVWGGAAIHAVVHASAVMRTSQDVEAAGGILFGSAIVIGVLRFLKRLMPKGTSVAAALVVDVAAYGFFVLVPPVLVALVTSGGSWSAIVAAMLGRGGHGFAADVFGAVRFACQLISLLLLVGVPAVLRRWLPWHTASEMARSLVPSWLAATAAILTWLYIVLLHFGGGALAHDPMGLIVVAGIGAASLLAPLFQFIARSCWEYGSLALLDPLRWRGAARTVADEIRRSRAAGASGRPGPPATTQASSGAGDGQG
jgi:hypothetical protein